MELQQVGHAGVPAARLQEQFVFWQNDHTAAESIAGGRSNAFGRTFGATDGNLMPTPRFVLNSLEICRQGISHLFCSEHTNQRLIDIDVLFMAFVCFSPTVIFVFVWINPYNEQAV